ncbi:MAG: glycosyltransferase family 4 protein [Panacagrimonas sp.]
MSQPITSFHLIASPRMGGAETTFVRVATALNGAGQPVIAGLRSGSALQSHLEDVLSVETFPLRNYLDVVTAVQIRSAIEQRGSDIVQTWASRATWLTRAPGHTIHVARLGGYYKLRYFRHADAWVVNTRGLRDWLVERGFPPDRVEWINNFVPPPTPGVPLSLTRDSLHIPPEALVVVALGRFVEKKGFSDLLLAFARLPVRIGDRPLHLVLLGDGPLLADLRSAAAGLGARVHFTGWVDHPVDALALGDVFVCPSRVEPMGNVVIEAWSRGLPVICTETAGGCELIQSGDTGLLCPVADVPRLAAAMDRVLRDAALRAALGAHGEAHYRHRYSEQKTVAAYLDFYRRLLRDARPLRARTQPGLLN